MIVLIKQAHAFIKDNFQLLIKYGIISAAYYLYIFAFTYMLIDVCSVNVTISYIITYGLAYISEYYVNIRILFKVTHKHIMFVKYVVHIVFFLFIGSALFSLLFSFFNATFHAMFATIACLFPLRFISYKLFVYRSRTVRPSFFNNCQRARKT